MNDFYKHLKAIRLSQGKTQTEIATAIGLSERNYQSFEYGEVKPSFDALVALADFFNVSLDYLVGRNEKGG